MSRASSSWSTAVVGFESRGPILEVCWEHSLRAVDHEEWGVFSGPAWRRP